MNVEAFGVLIKDVTNAVADKPLTTALGEELDRLLPPADATFRAIQSA